MDTIFIKVAPDEYIRKALHHIAPEKLVYEDGKYRTTKVNEAIALLGGKNSDIVPLVQSLQRLAKESKASGQSITSAIIGLLKGGGGVIALFSLASTAAMLFGDKLFSIKGKAESAAGGIDTLKEAAEGLVSLSGRGFKIVGSQRDLSLGALGLSAEDSRLKDEIRRANADIVSLTQAEFVELQKKQARLTTIQALQNGVLKAVGSEGRERRLAAEASKFGLQIEFQKETTTKNRKATLAEIRALQDKVSGALKLQGSLGDKLNRVYGELLAKQLASLTGRFRFSAPKRKMIQD